MGPIKRFNRPLKLARQLPRPPFLLKMFLSGSYTYAQIVRSEDGHIVASASTIEQAVRESDAPKTGIPACTLVGNMVAERCKQIGLTAVHWDRKPGEKYHGRRRAMLDAIVSSGVQLN